ncbi:hypothetical protein [Paenibacillus sp. DMB5]|uniref:hypothetical protein n=1 Tax=Paenibacillus sp. DMB5 TaxID=1780103 RepID=UPI00076BFEE3|nr:hypothetical protein [Paenibacillus sp. DMB5]KUP23928.1 hypothetical protein AWJ19_12340 [Paenibacillus sp. DMB5]
MKIRRGMLYQYILPAIWAVIAVLLSFFTEKYFINATPMKVGYISSKLVYFVYIFFISKFLISFILKIKEKDEFYKKWLSSFLKFLIPYVIILSVAWPGYFSWDEFSTYQYTTWFQLDVWQSILTSFFYINNLYIFPSIGTIVVIQVLFMSFVVSWVCTKIEFEYKPLWMTQIFWFIIVFTPAIAISTLVTYRSTMIGILELWICAILFFTVREKSMNIIKLLILALLTALLSSWRIEGIYHLVIVTLFLIFFFWKTISKKYVIFFVVTTLSVFFLFNNLYSIFYGDPLTKMRYSLTSYLNPLTIMLTDRDALIENKHLEAFNKVIDLDKAREMYAYYETPSFWNGAVNDSFSESDLTEFKKSFWSVAWRNKDVYLSARFRTMIASSGISNYGIYPRDTINTYFQFPDEAIAKEEIVVNTLKNDLNKPFNLKMRKLSASFLKFTVDHPILFWNYIPVVLLLLIFLIRTFHINNPLTWLTIMVLARLPILFVFEPGSYFMYYYPIFLSGILLLVLFILEFVHKKRSTHI